MALKLRHCLSGVALLWCAATPAWAQTGVIAGVVTFTETNRPAASAKVDAVADGRTAASTLTNADGRYRLTVPAGTYDVTVEIVGYELTRVPGVTVTAAGNATADVALRAPVYEIDPVVVSASRGPEPASKSPQRVVGVGEQEVRARVVVTPVDYLRSVPGVDVISAGVQSTNVAVRGFNNIFSGSLHTLTDNRIAGVPSLRVNLMHFIPQTSEDISRMEVVLGPGSALYGPNTANGVLHIITKSPLENPGTAVSVAGGERDLFHGTFRTAHRVSEAFGFKLSGQYVRAEEWNYGDPAEDAERTLAQTNEPVWRARLPLDVDGSPLTEEEIQLRKSRIGVRDFDIMRWSGDARADWRLTSDVTATFGAGLTNSGDGIELTGIGAGQAKDWRYGYYQTQLRWRRLFAQAYVNTSDAGDTYLLRTGAPIVDRSKVFVSQLQHSMSVRGRQDFAYGIDFISTMPETEGTINGRREDDDNYSELGAYLQSRTALTRQLALVAAGRGDYHSEMEKWFFSPRAALVFSPTESQSLRLSYNEAFSTPSSLNLFLDLDAGPAPSPLGPLGFRLRAQGPGAGGITFRDAAGDLHGIRSPFAAAVGAGTSDLIAPTPQALYDLQLTGFFAASAAQGQPIPGTLQAYMRGLRIDPALGQIGLSQFDPVLRTTTAVTAASLQNIPGIEESRTRAFEVGYTGSFGKRLLLAADAWFERRTNFTSPLILQSPLALLTPEQLAAFLIPRLTPVVGAQQAATIAAAAVQVPAGVFSSPDITPQGPALLVTYRNFGEVDINGFDLSASYLLTEQLQIGATASLVSDYYFTLPLQGSQDQPVALNAPKEKGTASLTYRDVDRGMNAELRVRYNGEFPANSSGYIGLSCITGNAPDGPCVESYTLVDFSAGYTIPRLRGASVQLNITNVFDEPYQSFIGVAEIGRLALLRLRYEF